MLLQSHHHSPVSVAVSVPGVPPPDVVHDGELYQSREHEGGAGAHPDVQGLSEDHSSVLFRCTIQVLVQIRKNHTLQVK